MAAGFNTLEIGKRALLAQRTGIDLTSNNIANLNTPGYTKQQVVFAETQPDVAPGRSGFIGTGVMVSRIDNVRTEFFDKGIRDNVSSQGSFAQDSQVVQRIEASMNESSDYGIDASVKQLFAGFADLSLRPESLDKRNSVLDAAQSLVAKFHTVGQSLTSIRNDVKSTAISDVAEINRQLQNIASYNNQIAGLSGTSQGGSSFADERNVAIETLAKYANISVVVDQSNIANISLGGSTVVSGTSVSKLQIKEVIEPNGQEHSLQLNQLDSNGKILGQLTPTSGEVATLMRHYNVTLDGSDSSGGFSVVGELNSLAGAVVEKINAVHATGYGLNDTGTSPARRDFFAPNTTNLPITTQSISINPALVGHPENVAAADAPNEPGNNNIARKIGELINDQSFISGTDALSYYASTVTRVGNLGADAINGVKTSALLATQLNSQRDAVNSVNMDEEAVKLIQYQKGFEASARIINTSSEMLQTIVNLGK